MHVRNTCDKRHRVVIFPFSPMRTLTLLLAGVGLFVSMAIFSPFAHAGSYPQSNSYYLPYSSYPPFYGASSTNGSWYQPRQWLQTYRYVPKPTIPVPRRPSRTNACQPHICSDGATFPTCSAQGYPINYLLDPCFGR